MQTLKRRQQHPTTAQHLESGRLQSEPSPKNMSAQHVDGARKTHTSLFGCPPPSAASVAWKSELIEGLRNRLCFHGFSTLR